MKKILTFLLLTITGIVAFGSINVEANVETVDPSLEPKFDDFTNAKLFSNDGHLYAITEDNTVYKKYGFTDLPWGEVDITHFEQNVFNEGEHFVQFAGGQYVYVGLTNEGRLFSWGTYYYGELGNGMMEYVWTEPGTGFGDSINLLDFYVDIEDAYEFTGEFTTVKSTGNTVFALTSGGELYIWGNCNLSSSPNLDEDMCPTAQIFVGTNDLESNEEIIDFYISHRNVMMITNQNRILMAGSNMSGILGDGSYDSTPGIGGDTTINPVKGDSFAVLDILEEGDVVTDAVMEGYAAVIVNDEDLWIWGSIKGFIDDDFRTTNSTKIQYENDDDTTTDSDGNLMYELFVQPSQFELDFAPHRVLELNQSYQMIVFDENGVPTSFGDEYLLVDDFGTGIDLDNMVEAHSSVVYLSNIDPHVYSVGIFGSSNINKVFMSGRPDDIVDNKYLPKTLVIGMPNMYNPTSYEYSYLITLSDMNGNILYSTEADDNINQLVISDDNDAIPKGLLKENTTYQVDVYLYYYVEGIKIGPFEFVSAHETTMPPLGEAHLTAVNVNDDAIYVNDQGEEFVGYKINLKLEQSYYDYKNTKSGYKIILFDDTPEIDCTTRFDNGLCLVQDQNISVVTDESYYWYNDEFIQHISYDFRYWDDNYFEEGLGYNIGNIINLDVFGNVYFLGLDESVNYTYRVYMYNNLFGNFYDEANPSLGKDGLLGEFEIDWDLSYKLPPSVTIGTEEYTDRGITIPVTEVEDLTDAILRNEVYFNVCDEEMNCKIYWDDLDEEVTLDGLKAGNYTVEVYYEYNINDNTGINQEVLGTYNVTIEPGSPIVELGDVELSNDDISIDILNYEDLDNTLVGTEIYVDLCIEDVCETTIEDINSNDIDVKNIDYGVYDIKAYIEYDLGNGTEELIIVEDEVSYLPEISASVNVSDDSITVNFTKDSEVEVLNGEYIVSVCTEACIEVNVLDTASSHVFDDLENGTYTIKVEVIFENDINNYKHLVLEEEVSVNVNKVDATVVLGEIETTKDSITIPIVSVTDTDGVIIDDEITVEYCLEDVCETLDVSTSSATISITGLEEGTYQVKVYVSQDKQDNLEQVLLDTSIEIGGTTGCKASLTIGSSLIGIIGLFGGAIIVIRKYFI